MRYLTTQEITLLMRILNQEIKGREVSLSTVIEDVFEKGETGRTGAVTNFLVFLEKEGVLNFENVHISKSHFYYNDIFLIRFFEALKTDNKKASEMLKDFNLAELSKLVQYQRNNLGKLLELIGEFTKKIKRIYFEDSDTPFRAQIINSILFDVKTNESELQEFVDTYIREFMNDGLVNHKEVETNYTDEGKEYHIYNEKYYPYHTQKLIFLHSIKEETKESGYTNLFLWGEITRKAGFRKFETILSAEKEGWIKIVRQQDDDATDFVFNINKQPFETSYQKHEQELNNILKKIERNDESLFIAGGNKEQDSISVQLKNGLLRINKNTGIVFFNKIQKELNPRCQEFKIILKLATNKDYQATYTELLGENVSKVNKRNLAFVIRNLKEALAILPIRNAKNRDIIKNIKRHGYKLIT